MKKIISDMRSVIVTQKMYWYRHAKDLLDARSVLHSMDAVRRLSIGK